MGLRGINAGRDWGSVWMPVGYSERSAGPWQGMGAGMEWQADTCQKAPMKVPEQCVLSMRLAVHKPRAWSLPTPEPPDRLYSSSPTPMAGSLFQACAFENEILVIENDS